MKVSSVLLSLMCLVSFSVVQAQIIADFEVEASGTQGFSNPGWGAATTAVERIADPTGRSVGVLAVTYDGTLDVRGNFEKQSFSPQNAHVISMLAWIPANFGDTDTLYVCAQDNQHWSDSRIQYYTGANLPRESWVAINYYVYGNYLANPTVFNPYDPYTFGRMYFQINSTTFQGQVLFDDLTLLGDVPRVQADFETGSLNGWEDSGWSPGISGVELIEDPNDAGNHVMSIGLDATLGDLGQLTSGQINLTTLDHVMAFKVWVPTDFPDENYIRIVGQDRTNWADGAVQDYYGSDLVKGEWNEIYLDILRAYQTDSTQFIPYTSGGFGRVWIGFYDNTTFTGSIYMDDIIFCQPAPPATADLLSPPITVTAGVDTIVDPYTGETLYFNAIEFTELAADIGETYSLYYSESGKITDVTAPGVIQISKNIPRGTGTGGVGRYNHRIFTADGGQKTVYYAMTVTGIEGGGVVEKPVIDGTSNSGAMTAKTSILHEIPFVENFDFVPDAYLDEFEDLATTFTRCALKTESTGELHGPEWTTASTDLNFVGYIVMDNENLYVGMDVVDDNPSGDGQCWEGDGFDVYGGLYDTSGLTSYWRGDDAQRGGDLGGAYRIGAAINAAVSDRLQVGGWEPWQPDGLEYVQEIFADGYIVEFKIPYADMDSYFNSSFVPTDGMLIPLKIDINDNDGAEDNPGGANNRSLQCHFGDTPANANSYCRAETWTASMLLTSTPMTVAVEAPEHAVPYTFALDRNFPNPFNPSTTLKYQVAHATGVKIVVYDLLGKTVRTLVDARKQVGSHEVEWNGTNDAGLQVSSGVYFARMVTPEYTKIQKMMLLK